MWKGPDWVFKETLKHNVSLWKQKGGGGGRVGGRMEELNWGYVQMLAEISSTKCNIDTDKESSSRFLGLVWDCH